MTFPSNITDEMKSDVISRLKAGERIQSIADTVGVSPAYVSRQAARNGLRRYYPRRDAKATKSLRAAVKHFIDCYDRDWNANVRLLMEQPDAYDPNVEIAVLVSPKQLEDIRRLLSE